MAYYRSALCLILFSTALCTHPFNRLCNDDSWLNMWGDNPLEPTNYNPRMQFDKAPVHSTSHTSVLHKSEPESEETKPEETKRPRRCKPRPKRKDTKDTAPIIRASDSSICTIQ